MCEKRNKRKGGLSHQPSYRIIYEIHKDSVRGKKNQHGVVSMIKSQNLKLQSFRFESDGLKTWKSREGASIVEEKKGK